jgi:hypothetical protein
MAAPADRPMWRCPRCGRTFANRNQTHTCRALGTVEDHLAGKPPTVVATYRAYEAMVRSLGEVDVLAEKTRIAFHRRMSFAGAVVLSDRVRASVVLAERRDSPRFTRVETYSPRNHVHTWEMRSPEEVDDQVRTWLEAAFAVGEQRHLDRRD